jgi:hypothetical protein
MIISVDVYDKDSGKNDSDDFLGNAHIQVGKLLAIVGGKFDVKLCINGVGTGAFITLIGDKVDQAENPTSIASAINVSLKDKSP